jgi:thiol-disulfide isomerase/thioredoxin
MSQRLTIRWLSLWLLACAGLAIAADEDGKGAAGLAPPLLLTNLQGQPRSLADYPGRVVLVNFWASWCGPCITEIPSLRDLYETMAGEPFEVLAVNVKEGRFKVHKFSRMMALPFPVLMDPEGEAFASWEAQVLPTSFLVDADGRVRQKIQGPLDWTSEEVVQTIRALLPRPSAVLTATPGRPGG